MGVGSGGQEPPPWIFIHDTDKVEGSLIVLFFGLVFFRCTPPPLENFFAEALGDMCYPWRYVLVHISVTELNLQLPVKKLDSVTSTVRTILSS